MSKPNRKPAASPVPAGELADGGLSFEGVLPDGPVVVEGSPTEPADSRAAQLFHAQAATRDIDATALVPGLDCPFTDGCRGKVRVFNTLSRNVAPEGQKTEIVTLQQLQCNKCKVVAKGARPTGNHRAAAGKLFNRLTAENE